LPYAELWIGDHVNGPSSFHVGMDESLTIDEKEFTDSTYNKSINLSELFKLNPTKFLGKTYEKKYP